MWFFFFFFQAEDGIRDAQESRGLGDVYKRQVLRQALERMDFNLPAAFTIGCDESLLHLERMIFIVGFEHEEDRWQFDFLFLIDDRLRAAFGHRFFRPPVIDMGFDKFLTVELLSEAEAIQRTYKRPPGDNIRKTRVDVRMLFQRQR